MTISEYPLISMDTNEYLWISMTINLNDYQWISIDYQWILMNIYESQWSVTNTYRYQFISMYINELYMNIYEYPNVW
jgi:hypothetical protein